MLYYPLMITALFRETLAGVIARLKVRQAQMEISGLMKGKHS